tara:strand:+ start:103 stop:576 length:474 start_codon:yes stop_codon:yes gene_type:complete
VKTYAATDAVRKHALKEHDVWLKRLDATYKLFKYQHPQAPNKHATEFSYCIALNPAQEDVKEDVPVVEVKEDVPVVEVKEKDVLVVNEENDKDFLRVVMWILYNRITESVVENKDPAWSVGDPPSGSTVFDEPFISEPARPGWQVDIDIPLPLLEEC